METPESNPYNPEREDRTFFTSLFFIIMLSGLVMLFTACDHRLPEPACGDTYATIRDLTGLDGCGYVLELDNGERLIPSFQMNACEMENGMQVMYVKPMFPGLNLQDGVRVRIRYQVDSENVNTCMAGTAVKIECLEQVPTSQTAAL